MLQRKSHAVHMSQSHVVHMSQSHVVHMYDDIYPLLVLVGAGARE